ncbi:alpha-amylase family protein [Novosphingobium sp. P6W]|uniref:alpha-amylase family protein n=1 Tax=Novosphingobium sp. P6W TaxID=1609758 RepID=UPI0005C2AA4C|nr:alpha-amylase family protein [Novosphingobium sp. P6W]AXB80140.1 hypothetical protein TQ38_026415 [Novosphingobium sp. P6W]KIS29364.1 hypothetical protein TQ38_28955 [Novosphingobium sp. P6W]
MKLNRREFAAMGGTAAVMALLPHATQAAAAPGAVHPDDWHQSVRRIMQINFTEPDPMAFDVGKWIDYLVSVHAQCTFVSITNIVAFFPPLTPGFPRSRWLGERDIVSECARAARSRGIRVLGRLSIDTALTSLATDHPDWFRRRPDGGIAIAKTLAAPPSGPDPSSSADYGRTCQFSSYYSEYIADFMREVMRRYGIDGIYANGWPNANVPLCYCEACRTIGDPTSESYRIAYQARAFQLWDRYARIVSTRDPQAVFSGNLGGGIEGGVLDFKALADRAIWMFADNQGRHKRYTPSWDASQQARVGRSLTDGKRPSVVSTGAWSFIGADFWRSVTANPEEMRSRMFQTLAAGGVVHLHWLGFERGFEDDRRWQAVGRDVLAWQAGHDRHFRNLRSLAKVAVVVSPLNNRAYRAPAGTDPMDALQGIYKVLVEARTPFDFVLDGHLSEDVLARYDVLVLPNIALMSDATAGALRAYAKQGGSILATFETGVYDEAGQERADFALSDVFGVHKTGSREGYGYVASDGTPVAGAVSMQRIERPHPIVNGFLDTNWIAGSSWRMPIAATGNPVLTHIPQHPVYPVEAVYSDRMHTALPTMVAGGNAEGRFVYLAEDIDAAYWRDSAADLGDLLTGALEWLVRDRKSVKVEGPGFLDLYAWRTEPGYAVHLVNHTNPDFRGGAFRQVYPVGTQELALTLDAAEPVRMVRLLRKGIEVAFRQDGSTVYATIPEVGDYEVIAFEL